MDAKTAMNLMIDNSGKTPAELSEDMGRGRTYIYTMRKQQSVPRVDTFARFCHVCGYKLKLEREDGRQIELYSEADSEARFCEIGEDESTTLKSQLLVAAKDPTGSYADWPGAGTSEATIGRMASELADDPDFQAKHPEHQDDPEYHDYLMGVAWDEASKRFVEASKQEEEGFFTRKSESPSEPEDV